MVYFSSLSFDVILTIPSLGTSPVRTFPLESIRLKVGALSNNSLLILCLTSNSKIYAPSCGVGKNGGGVSKSMLKQSRLNFDKIEKCE